MIVLEGLMLVPPERGTIIGRALWKPRYVVLGTGSMKKTQTALLEDSKAGAAKKGLKTTSSKQDVADMSQPDPEGKGLFLSIYKNKGDWEYLAQHPISTFKSCEIKDVAHRKQSPSLPTLMLEMKPDIASEKARKRRSSRTGGLSSKDPWSNTLLFRTALDERHNVYDWQITLKPYLTVDDLEENPMSPTSPVFNSFTNPFAQRETRTAGGSVRKPEFTRSSTLPSNSYPHAPPPRPFAMISPSPSLRSKRSDLSSQASSQHPPMGFASHYPNTLPTDLPSPASTSGYDTQFIEGWTSAQGRSSALSSHTRGSNSMASVINPMMPSQSTPPGPRETILDRAFQLKCIPGSERLQEIEEGKQSSIARFEALMREVDERKQVKAQSRKADKEELGWNLDEDSSGEANMSDEDDEPNMSDDEISMPTPAQRALDYISGRSTPAPSASRPLSPAPRSPPIPFLNNQAMSAFHGLNSSSGGLRPRTGTTSSRTKGSRPVSMALPSRSISTSTLPTLRGLSSNGNLRASKTGPIEAISNSSNMEKRRSSTSVKRLSFTDFAKRLSSTSSLLLVQTNASSSSGREGSRRGSSEYGEEGAEKSGLRGGGLEKENRDKRCGWRGSVGVFGSEGGFL